MKKYACIKDNVVENVLLFEDFDETLFNLVIAEHGYDELVEASDDVRVGYTYSDSNFVSNLTYVDVPNVIGMTVQEAKTLLEELTLQVETIEGFVPTIVSIAISSNKLIIETMERNYANVNDTVILSSLENEDLNGTYQISSIVNEHKFVVDKNAANLEEVQVPFGKAKILENSGKVCYQSILPAESGILENAPIVISAFAE